MGRGLIKGVYEKGYEKKLSHADILDIQEKFLSAGYHVIQVPSVSTSRVLVERFISAISFFPSSVCIVSVEESVPSCAVSFVDIIRTTYGSVNNDSVDAVLLSDFYFDFCWIEHTVALNNTSWFGHFKNRLFDFNIIKSLPILSCNIV